MYQGLDMELREPDLSGCKNVKLGNTKECIRETEINTIATLNVKDLYCSI